MKSNENVNINHDDDKVDEAAFIDAFFLPGGIFDPFDNEGDASELLSRDNDDNNSSHHHHRHHDADSALPGVTDVTSSLLFSSSSAAATCTAVPSSSSSGTTPWLDSAVAFTGSGEVEAATALPSPSATKTTMTTTTTTTESPAVSSSWFGQHFLMTTTTTPPPPPPLLLHDPISSLRSRAEIDVQVQPPSSSLLQPIISKSPTQSSRESAFAPSRELLNSIHVPDWIPLSQQQQPQQQGLEENNENAIITAIAAKEQPVKLIKPLTIGAPVASLLHPPPPPGFEKAPLPPISTVGPSTLSASSSAFSPARTRLVTMTDSSAIPFKPPPVSLSSVPNSWTFPAATTHPLESNQAAATFLEPPPLIVEDVAKAKAAAKARHKDDVQKFPKHDGITVPGTPHSTTTSTNYRAAVVSSAKPPFSGAVAGVTLSKDTLAFAGKKSQNRNVNHNNNEKKRKPFQTQGNQVVSQSGSRVTTSTTASSKTNRAFIIGSSTESAHSSRSGGQEQSFAGGSNAEDKSDADHMHMVVVGVIEDEFHSSRESSPEWNEIVRSTGSWQHHNNSSSSTTTTTNKAMSRSADTRGEGLSKDTFLALKDDEEEDTEKSITAVADDDNDDYEQVVYIKEAKAVLQPAKTAGVTAAPTMTTTTTTKQKPSTKRQNKQSKGAARDTAAADTASTSTTATTTKLAETTDGLDSFLGLYGAVTVYMYDSLTYLSDVGRHIGLWVTEILYPALLQSFLATASSAMHSWRGIFLLILAAFHAYSFAADETLAQINLESAWIPYVSLIYAPTATRHIMHYIDLPHWAPHIVSSAVLGFLLRRPSGTISNVKRGPGSKPSPEDLRNFVLRCCQLLIPFDLVMDGFSSVNTAVMTLSYTDRLLLAYLICVVRKGWMLVPCAWLSFAVQCLVSVYFPWKHILAEPILLFILFSIGMASLNLLRILEHWKQRAKKAIGKTL